MKLPETCEKLLQQMVAVDTVNGAISGRPHAEMPLALLLESLAQAMGFATTRLPVDDAGFNLLVTHDASPDAPWLLFESHLDTVSAEHMTIDPFAGHIEGGRMYGRGTCDTKGSGAAMLWALKECRRKAAAAGNVAILYTLDEEIGKTGITAFAERHLATLGWRPSGVIVGEPTELRPVVAHNGVVRWTIRTHGVAAHSSDPSRGSSAISMMVRVIDAIESRYIPGLTADHPLTGRAQCSVNVIHGGTQVNIIPESCEIRVDRRVVPGENAHEVVPAVERLLDTLKATCPALAYTQEHAFIDSPLDPAGSESFIAFVQRVLAGMGLPADAIGAGYGTDASAFARENIPAVVLGPGSIAQAHTRDEWLALDQLHAAVELYGNLMRHPMEGRK